MTDQFSGIITRATDNSTAMNSQIAQILRRDDVEVRTFRESGYFLATGYKGNERIAYAHCNSEEEFETIMGLLRPSNDWSSFGSSGSGYLFSVTATFSTHGETSHQEQFFICSDEYPTSEQITDLVVENIETPGEGMQRAISTRRCYWDELPNHERPISLNTTTTFQP